MEKKIKIRTKRTFTSRFFLFKPSNLAKNKNNKKSKKVIDYEHTTSPPDTENLVAAK